MAIYKVRTFNRFARKHRIGDTALRDAANKVRAGRFDADLGGGLYKQRIARSGGGKSGGFRTLISRNTSEHLFFVYGFPKSARANINADELKALQAQAKVYGALTRGQLDLAVARGELEELDDGAQEDHCKTEAEGRQRHPGVGARQHVGAARGGPARYAHHAQVRQAVP